MKFALQRECVVGSLRVDARRLHSHAPFDMLCHRPDHVNAERACLVNMSDVQPGLCSLLVCDAGAPAGRTCRQVHRLS